jgi:hypothetical protein
MTWPNFQTLSELSDGSKVPVVQKQYLWYIERGIIAATFHTRSIARPLAGGPATISRLLPRRFR